MSNKRRPDFVIVGAMKSATTTLHDLLAMQNGIFMTEPKEPCFFSDDDIYEKGLGWYGSLYSEANENDIKGESSTHYTKLPTYPDTIERLKQYAPNTKIIYIIRHPIDRLISQYIHEWTERTITESIDKAIDRYPRLIDYSKYYYQIKPYIDTFGIDNVKPLFFEYFIKHQFEVVQEVCHFIGYEQKLVWNPEKHSNESSKRERVSRGRDAIVYSKPVTYVRTRFIPQKIRNYIKSFWMMNRRPVLSPDRIDRLEYIFNDDLRKFSESINLQLSCQNYKEVAATTSHLQISADRVKSTCGPTHNVGIVIIGRNEGNRLKSSIAAAKKTGLTIVYVDSDSSDGSLDFAKNQNIEAISLETSLPMNMARGRNAGFKYLHQHYPNTKYVQFIDGDCVIDSSWIDIGTDFMEKNSHVAIVSGRREEMYPEASVYNSLIDIEWDTPVGEVKYCHGDALFRMDALVQSGGFNNTMICGEEPELCIRIRSNNWKVHRLDAPMTLHDADMRFFSEWWRRSIRGGWGFAQGYSMHGRYPEHHWRKELFSTCVWGLFLPLVILITFPIGLILFISYLLQFWRISRSQAVRDKTARIKRCYAFLTLLSKVPASYGVLKFWASCVRKRNRHAIIEYSKEKA